MNIIKKYGLTALIVLNTMGTIGAVWYTIQVQHTLSDIVGALGESRILERGQDGNVYVNKVITVADVQKSQEVERPNGVK